MYNYQKGERDGRYKSTISRISKWRQTSILADIEELSYGEICQILNKTIPQVKMVVHRDKLFIYLQIAFQKAKKYM